MVDNKEQIITALNDLQDLIASTNIKNGWHDYFNGLDLNSTEALDHIITKLALIVTEVAEGIEELRNGHGPGETYYVNGKMEGLPSELADVLIRVLDLAALIKIYLSHTVVEKLEFNATRGKHHGGKKV